MGLGMPKFIVNGYNSFKEKCYSVKETYNSVKEGLKMAKSLYKVAKKLETANFAETRDPQALADAINNTDGISEAYKDIISSVDKETLGKMTQLMFDSFSNKKNIDTSAGNSTDGNQLPNLDFEKVAQSMYTSLQNEGNEPKLEHSVEKPAETQSHTSRKTETRAQNSGSDSQDKKMDTKPPDPSTTFNPTSNSTDYKTTKKYHENESTDFIPSETYRKIMNNSQKFDDISKGTSEPQNPNEIFNQNYSNKRNEKTKETSSTRPNLNFTQNNSTRQNQDQNTRTNIPPMTKLIQEELQKKFGPNWKQRIPSFVHDPEKAGHIPDLGLGLDKAGNRDMVIQMSKVLKDLM